MKIAFDLRPVQSFSKYRGLGSYTANLIKALSGFDRENFYYLLCWDEKRFPLRMDFPEGFNFRKVFLPHIPALRQLNWFSDKVNFPGILRALDADVIHITSPLEFSFSFSFFKSKAGFIVTVYDLIPLKFPRWYFSGRKKFLKPLYDSQLRQINKCRKIIAGSKNTAKDIEKLLGIDEEKITPVYAAASESFKVIKDEKILRAAADKYGIKQPVVLYVGGFDSYKNVEKLLEAFSVLQKNIKPLYLVMPGKSAPQRLKALENKIESLGIKDNVLMPGFVPEEDLVKVYNLAKVFVFPSVYEGFGLPPLEAMSCGIPVISSAAASLPEVTGDAAILVNPEDTEDIVSALRKVLEDEGLRMELSEKGLKRAGEFSWKKTALKTLEVYRSILTPLPIFNKDGG